MGAPSGVHCMSQTEIARPSIETLPAQAISEEVLLEKYAKGDERNIAAVNQLCDPLAGATCSAGHPTASYDARQFQFALKVSW